MPKPMIDIPLASLRCSPEVLCPDDPKRLTRSRRRSAVGETRKLAAILVSDVVGYSRLTGADEDRILARLRAPLSATTEGSASAGTRIAGLRGRHEPGEGIDLIIHHQKRDAPRIDVRKLRHYFSLQAMR